MDGVAPAVVPNPVITALKRREVGGLIELPVPPRFHRGDRVRILHGAFIDRIGLVAGMIGAQASFGQTSHAVLVAGVAGMVADALSMGSSGYLAAKSEREVLEHELSMEREEIRLMPELEREELSLVYQAKGMRASQADALAEQVMGDPERALAEQAREELGIAGEPGSPMREAWITGIGLASSLGEGIDQHWDALQQRTVNADETLYRIDLRDFDWDRAIVVEGNNFNDVWEAIAANKKTGHHEKVASRMCPSCLIAAILRHGGPPNQAVLTRP